MNRMSTKQTQHPLKQMKKSTSFSGISQNSNQETSKIFYATILKCLICKSKVRNAHMCPNCCKLFCQVCIKNWVINTKPQCPNCYKNLRLISIVNCEHLGQQIEEAITRNEYQFKPKTPQLSSSIIQPFHQSVSTHLSRSNVSSQILSPNKSMDILQFENRCDQHDLKLDYYCQQCKISLCPDCAVLTNKHHGHKLSKLSLKQKRLHQEVKDMRQRIIQMRKNVLDTKQKNVELKNKGSKIQLQRINQFFCHVKKMQDLIINQLDHYLTANQGTLQQIKPHYFSINQKINRLEQQLSSLPSTQFILRQNQYQKQLSQIQIRQFIISSQQPLKINYFTEQFNSTIITLPNFTKLKYSNTVFYSEIHMYEGIQWRLRIHPNGKQNLSQPYISIYLEMISSPFTKPSVYTYKFEIMNQTDPNKKISQQSQNQFQTGTYWGYDRFCKVSSLYLQKYISVMNDCLKIKLSIRNENYLSAISKKNIQINEKSQILKQNLQRLIKLRQRIAQKGRFLNSDHNDKVSNSIHNMIDEGCNKPQIHRIYSERDIENKNNF